MLNFKFVKFAPVFFVLAFVLFFHNISLAQERSTETKSSVESVNRGNVANSGMTVLIENAKIKKGEGEIEIEAVLFNPSPTVETPLATYLLILNNIDPLAVSQDIDYTPSPLIISAQEGKDYFSLKPNERKTVKYSLSVSRYLPIANYALNFRLMRRDGDIVGQRREILRNFGFNQKKSSQGNYEKGFLAFFQESCVILNAKGDKFEPNEGPVFNPLEQPKVKCAIKNIGDEDIAVHPKIEWKEFFVYGRPSSGVRLEETQDNVLTFKKGETKSVEISLPRAKEPQVYQALLSFGDADGVKRSFNMPFRWTIGGSSARVDKVNLMSQLKNIYQKGETMSLSVDYFGSMDLYWENSGDESAGLSGLKISVVVKDKTGEICGQKDLNLPNINDSTRRNQIMNIVMEKKCENASYRVSILSGGEKLAEETAEVPKTAESKIMKIYYYAIATVLFLTLFALIKRRKKAIGPAVVIFFAFSAFGLFFNSADASAIKSYSGSAYGGENYGGSAASNSDPLYSFYGVNDTSNVNKLVIKNIETNLDTDLNGFYADIYYAAGFTSCSNSTMQIRFKMYIEADDLSKTQVNFAPSGSVNYQPKQIREYTSITYKADEELFDIDPSFLKNFYDSNGKMRTNPRLIVEIVQSGKSTHTNPYHRGDFSKPVSTVDFASRSAAFDASDMIRYTIPLNLPAPSLSNFSLNGTSPIDYNCKPSLNWTVNDVSSCNANGGWSGSKSAANGTHSETMTSGITASTNYGLSCSKNLGSAIGTKTYSDNVTVGVNSRPTADLKANGSDYDIDVKPSGKVALTWTRSSSWSSCDLKSYDGSNITTIVSNTGVTGSANVTMGSAVGSYKTFSLSCSNSCGYKGLDSQKATVKDGTSLSVTCSASPSSVGVGSDVTFTATASGGTSAYTYAWTGTDITSGASGTTGSTITKSYSTTGTKNAIITVKDNVDAQANYTCSVNVTIGGEGGDPPTGGACNNNGVQDNGETGVDCGGGNCSACGTTTTTTPSCSDGIQNQDETGVDTGGVCTTTTTTTTKTLTINIAGSTSGTVSDENGVTLCHGSAGASCSLSYTTGTVLSALSAAGDSGYSFDGWGGDCSISGNNCSVTLDDNRTISASFGTNSGPITCTSNCDGTGGGDPPTGGSVVPPASPGGSSSSSPGGGVLSSSSSSSSSSRPSVIIQEI